MLILVVEDDADLLEVTVEVLGTAGFTAEGVRSGPEAIARLEGGLAADLVVLDLVMPGMSGYEVLEVLRSRWPELPVLVCTALPRAQVLGAAGMIQKPYAAEQLLGAVARGLRPAPATG